MSTTEQVTVTAGDVVIVKGQTVKMTVEGYCQDFPGRVACVWFVGSKLHRDSFIPFTLQKVNA